MPKDSDAISAQRDLLWQTRLTHDELAALCARSPQTVKSWWRGQPMPAAVRLVCEIFAGRMPWRGFEGYQAAPEGLVYPPGARDPVPISTLAVADYERRRLELLERDLAELRRVPAQYIFDWDQP